MPAALPLLPAEPARRLLLDVLCEQTGMLATGGELTRIAVQEQPTTNTNISKSAQASQTCTEISISA